MFGNRDTKILVWDGKEVLGKELRKLLLNACIFKYTSALRVSEPERFKILECYNEMGEPIIRLHEILTEGAYVKIFKGKFIHERYSNGYGCERTVIVKLFESRDGKNNTAYEIDNYRYCGDPSPTLGVNCYLWNVPVLVMKRMEKLTTNDDEIEVGIQILQQLAPLHRFTLHSDLKRSNIFRDPDEKINGKPAYRFIDLGGCPRERKGIGYYRRTWTTGWAIPAKKGALITPKTDLLELGHVLTVLKYCRTHDSKKYPKQSKRTFSGKLKRYMQYVERIDETKTPHNPYEPHYKALIQILSEKNEKSQKSTERQDKRKRKSHNSHTKYKFITH